MFNAIHNLTQNAVQYAPFPDDKGETKNELDRRMEAVKEFIKNLGHSAGVDQAKLDALEIDLHGSFECASADHGSLFGKASIQAPLMFFIDFIKDFDVEDLENLENELQDLNNIDRFRKKICHIFNCSIPATNEVLRDSLLSYVQRMRADPEDMLNQSRFVLLHEFGHLQNDDILVPVLLTTLVVFLVFSTVLISVLEIGLLISATELSLCISFVAGAILALKISVVAEEILHAQFFGRSNEIAADRFAIEACPDAEREQIRQGGISFFQRQKDKQQVEPSWFDRLFDPHPTDAERIAMLENLV